jgi:hypothetical protein
MESRAIPNQSEVTEGVPYSFEDYFPNIDKHFRFTSVPLEDHFITTGADITSIKKAEEGLRRSEAVYRSIATNFPSLGNGSFSAGFWPLLGFNHAY